MFTTDALQDSAAAHAEVLCFDLEVCPDSGKGSKGPKPSVRSRRPEVDSDNQPVVFMYGHWRELALYRAEVLKVAGFSVLAPATREDALAAVQSGKYHVAILSYTLSSETVKEFADLIRQNCPGCPIITIAQSKSLDRHVLPDATVIGELGPSALVAAIKRVLRTQ